MTRSGRIHQSEASQPPPQSQPIQPILPLIEDNEIVKQLKKTKVEINIWKLLASSYEHRETVMNALTKIGVDAEIASQGLVNILTHNLPIATNPITFSDADLPPEGDKHNKALHLTVV